MILSRVRCGSGLRRCCQRTGAPVPVSGSKRAHDRAALAGIVFVLKTGITWNQLPHGVWLFGDDVLAAAAGLDSGGSLAGTARGGAGRAARPGSWTWAGAQ
jgi:hypothetical protein